MYQELLKDTTYFQYLYECDQKIAEDIRKNSCTCGGKLHTANYPRKPRGVPSDINPCFCIRFSFCCNQEGCRKRVTPYSLRFLGRKIYAAIVIIIVFTLKPKTASERIDQLFACAHITVVEETLRRWKKWWLGLPNSRPWRLQGLGTTIDQQSLPASLLESFKGSVKEKLTKLLLFLSPLTSTFSGACTRD